jgi:hypothetical protein
LGVQRGVGLEGAGGSGVGGLGVGSWSRVWRGEPRIRAGPPYAPSPGPARPRRALSAARPASGPPAGPAAPRPGAHLGHPAGRGPLRAEAAAGEAVAAADDAGLEARLGLKDHLGEAGLGGRG